MKESKFTKLLRFKAIFRTYGFSFVSNILDYSFRIIFNCSIPSSVTIGEGCKFAHSGLGCVINPKVKMGKNCKIFQKTTIDGLNESNPPVLGDNVYIGTGASILGDVRIGNNVRIGANAVILIDIPDNCTVLGNPGEIYQKRKS